MKQIIQAIDKRQRQAERIQHRVQKKMAEGSDKGFKELIEEEKRKELSIEEG